MLLSECWDGRELIDLGAPSFLAWFERYLWFGVIDDWIEDGGCIPCLLLCAGMSSSKKSSSRDEPGRDLGMAEVGREDVD